MPRVVQSGEFFVVGGPVQPDRACYIERPADAALLRGLLERRFCYVLGPKSSGKTSLMARTIRKLRADGQLAAVVDLTQIAARGEGGEAGRWYYSIAYRIVRELRLRVDLQRWWQEKSVLMSEQRLAEFFWEIVLANTSAPVTIFFDEMERALELSFSRELFVALSTCYKGRVTEPDYQRLNFVVLGVATPRQLGQGRPLPLFEDGLAIELGDFSLDETSQLADGFDSSEEQARAALNRIHYWVRGQPYLTQKIARAVARRGAHVEDVDNVVRGQFLSASAREEEPLLSHIAALLTARGPHSRRALVLLGKLGKGAPIVSDPDSPAQEILTLGGVTASHDEFLTYRNRLVKSVFTSRWAKSALPFDWRGAALAATVAALTILLPLWYTQYFPRPYIDTLTAVTDDYALALETHDKLRRFPGFGGTADSLLADIMVRRSRNASSYSEVQAADETLRSLAGYGETADELMGAYWLRRARAAVLRERRDEALVYADLAQVGRDVDAATLAASLIDADYPFLVRSDRFASSLAQWEVDWGSQAVTAVEVSRRAQRLNLATTAPAGYARPLTALQHVAVSRELGVDEPGSAGAFLLEIDIEHPSPEQLMLTLEAPSGASAGFGLTGESTQTHHEIRVTERSALASLADEDRQGVWRLTLVDREEGSMGRLDRWGLLFAEELRGWEDVPDAGLEIPDPERTGQIEVQLSADGRLGVARPSLPGASGAFSVWDLAAGDRLGDLQIDSMPAHSALTPDARHLITVSGNVLTIWDLGARAAVARIATQTRFVLPPAVGVDGEYVAIAEQLEADSMLYSLLRADDGELVASIEGLTGVRGWVLGPQARYLILVGPARIVRAVDPRRGNVILELPHERDPIRLAGTSDDRLISVDAAGDIFVWDLAEAQRGALEGRLVGVTVDPDGVSMAADGSAVAYEAANGRVFVRDLATDSIALDARVHRAGGPVRTRLAPSGSRLVTASGPLLQLWDVPAGQTVSRADAGVSVMALDRSGQLAALGYRDGHLRIRTTAQLQERIDSADEIEYIGHQGAVTSLAVNSAHSTIASGGRDGVVRVWDLATGVPTAPYMRHPDGPIQAVALSDDGRWVVSAAMDSARVWGTQDGDLALELPVNGVALAAAVAPDSSTVAVGDSAGNVFVADIAGSAEPRTARAQEGVTALAFSADGQRLASGDRSGRIQLWDPETVRTLGSALAFPHAIRWLGFSDDGQSLIAQTDHWAHRLVIAPGGLTVVASRLLDTDLEAGVAVGRDEESLRLIGGRDLGVVDVEELSWQPTPAQGFDTALLDRDWSSILSLRINDLANVVEVTR